MPEWTSRPDCFFKARLSRVCAPSFFEGNTLYPVTYYAPPCCLHPDRASFSWQGVTLWSVGVPWSHSQTLFCLDVNRSHHSSCWFCSCTARRSLLTAKGTTLLPLEAEKSPLQGKSESLLELVNLTGSPVYFGWGSGGLAHWWAG